MRIQVNKLLTPAGWRDDQIVVIEQGTITTILDQNRAGTGMADLQADILVPGLFDLHNHGGDGFDATQPSLNALKQFLNKMLSCGVTDMLMTISTGDPAVLKEGLAFVREAMAMQQIGRLGGTRIQGVHLEGPFLNRKRPGAMTVERILDPGIALFDQLFGDDIDIIREVTLAPEVPGAHELAAYLLRKGILVQAGHTDASFEEAQDAFGRGFSSICHTFNAARGIHHREPGILTAAFLAPSVYCEAICDFLHLHPAIIRLIYLIKGSGKMMIVSDSTMPTGLPDGSYQAANHPVIVKDGVKRTPAGALSGGICYLDQSVRNLISIGIPAEDAFRMASTTPAEHLGFNQLGAVRIGNPAHLAAFTHELMPDFTIVEQSVIS
ncbi:MAG: N-acetylglucosamine-6-phosphate deacetylase [Bacillota bacterium]|nr:N-acetylglucosamine-6-phosphate deacetylase [Bacillota bacterium]